MFVLVASVVGCFVGGLRAGLYCCAWLLGDDHTFPHRREARSTDYFRNKSVLIIFTGKSSGVDDKPFSFEVTVELDVVATTSPPSRTFFTPPPLKLVLMAVGKRGCRAVHKECLSHLPL